MEGIFEFLKDLLSALATVGVPLFLLAAFFGALAGVTRWRKRVGPNEALVVFGRGRTTYGPDGKPIKMGARIVTAGGTLVRPILEEAQKLDLRVMTIAVNKDKVITQPGVPIILDWVAQLQINPSEAGILTASRAFLGKTAGEIEDMATNALSGNFREVVATLTPEQVLREKEKFQQTVSTYATPEMERLGLTLTVLNVKEVYDEVGYYEALGKPQIAEVKKNARIAEAEADRDARMKAAVANETARKAEVDAETKVAEYEKDLAVKQADFRAETQSKKAAADVAYSLQEAERKKDLATKHGAAEVERQKQAGLAAEQTIVVAERQKQAEVVVPAEAEKEAAIARATGEAEANKLKAQGDADRTRLTKEAEATGIKAIGEAEGNASQAKLLGQAAGEKELAAARAAQDEINLRMAALEAWQAVNTTAVQAMAQAIGGLGEKVHIVQFAGASGGGQTGNLLVDFLMQTPELAATIVAKAEALAGKDIGTILAEVSGIARGTKPAGEQPKAEG